MTTRRSYIAEGWAALHQAALDIGAEFDYYPPDFPELGGRSYLDGETYSGLVSPLLKFSGVDPESLGGRSSVVKAAIWRCIRRTAVAEANPLWKLLIGLRSRTALMARLAEAMAGYHFAGAPKYSPSNPVSVARYGHWLIHQQPLRGGSPVVSILWGLALIGSAWGEHLRCGHCKICFRQSRPGGEFCDFHSQSGVTSLDRSDAYIRYRRGRLAKGLAKTRGLEEKLWPHPIERLISQRLALPEVLFQMKPHDGWSYEQNRLIMALKESPRVLQCIGGDSLLNLTYEDLVHQLMEHIDPHEWNYAAWPGKVLQAEIWFSLEEETSPGRRGRGHKTDELVQKACHLAAFGVRNGDIAAWLGVAPSTVSRWLKRYPEFAAACGLRSVISPSPLCAEEI